MHVNDEGQKLDKYYMCSLTHTGEALT